MDTWIAHISGFTVKRDDTVNSICVHCTGCKVDGLTGWIRAGIDSGTLTRE